MDSNFESPAIGWWLAIGLGMTATGILALSGPACDAFHEHVTASISRGAFGGIFGIAVALHLGEGLVALRIARRNERLRPAAFRWWAQTTLLGFPSLRLLLNRRN